MKQQAGFSLVMAIFILVVLGVLGGYMVKLSGVQHATSTFSLQSARAYQAAKTGIGWSIARLLATADCNDITSVSPLTFTDIDGFSVTLGCTKLDYSEASKSLSIYTLTAFSEFGVYNSAYYISRQVEVSICLDNTTPGSPGSCN
ncbi:MAG: hypothetical protein ACKE51_01320 [Methylococcaceae bacterium]